MAFSKTANAIIAHPEVDYSGWDKLAAKANVPVFNKRQAAKIVLDKYDPKQFLLSHATIVASVDTESGPGDLGRQVFNGFQIDRKYQDYYVTPETSSLINANTDCWQRDLLLASYPTFVGAESYVEHIQIPELSKGKIIDAAARDLGHSIYIDILVANDRKHKPLIAAITNGTLNTLSMGAQVQFTICTKCGNVAYDETQLCPCIKYGKGNPFFDKNGQKRITAELCGHISAEPGSCRFIEASWVGNPAFKGAVLRNILTPEEAKYVGEKVLVAFNAPQDPLDPSLFQRAAKVTKKADFGVGQDQGQQESPAPSSEPQKSGPFDKIVDDLTDAIKEHVTKKLREDIGKDEADSAHAVDINQNDTLIKSAMQYEEWRGIAKKVVASTKKPSQARKILGALITYKSEGWTGLIKTGSYSGRELLAVARLIDVMTQKTVIAGDKKLYQTVLVVGGMGAYPDIESYLTACRHVVGRDLSQTEVSLLIDRGRLFALGT